MPGKWITVAEKSALEPESAIGVTHGDIDIAIYLIGGELYATDNICPHAFGYLNHGYIDDDQIECPLHGAVFEIKTGKGVAGPFCNDLATFPVRIVGEEIQVEIPDATT
jgi:nitrite reductase/ring-hydroxylating ferredoxin subunit